MHPESSAADLPRGPVSWPPHAAWPSAVHRGIASFKDLIANWGLAAHTPAAPVLVAVSGGADSLALAVLAAEAQRITGVHFGAVILDHRLQAVTAAVAHRTQQVCQRLGLAPVVVRDLDVEGAGQGLEAAAREARYDAFVMAAQQTGAPGVLTAHTAHDQAEQVLLGLARGSGVRSLSGIRRDRMHQVPGLAPVRIGRPLLDLTRDETEAICTWAGLEYFQDPMNFDHSIARIRVRRHLLPTLMDPQTGLGPGVFTGLVTTAALAADDAAALDTLAAEKFAVLATIEPAQISFGLAPLRQQPGAILRRMVAIAAQHLGAPQPSFERLNAVQQLVFPPIGRASSAGPVQLEGHVSVYRKKTGQEYAKLLVIPSEARADLDTYEE